MNQQPRPAPTIRVRGTGSASLAPELGVIAMDLGALDLDYGAALAALNAQAAAIRLALGAAGFARPELKTCSLSVDPIWESDRIEAREGGKKTSSWEKRFTGYQARQTLRLEVPLAGDRLGPALRAVAGVPRTPFTLAFALKDPDTLKVQVLQAATRNARLAAEAMCTAAGATLGPLVSMDHSWVELHVEEASFPGECCVPEEAFEGLDPQDLKASDSVTCVWELR